MRHWEKERAAEISEIILVTHIGCLLAFLMVITSFFNFRIGKNFYLDIGFLVLVVSTIGAVYVGRKLLSKISFLGQARIDELLLIAIIFPVTFTFLWYTKGFFGGKVLLVVPIMIAATAFGSQVGIGSAVLASALLFLQDYKIIGGIPPEVFQTNLLVGSVGIILAWLVGSLMAVERRTQRQLARLADYDRLTGLVNHRYFQEKLAVSLLEAEQKQLPLTLILLDINQFRYYNAAYGHQKGDEMLAAIGALLQEEVKEPSFAARYGSDKFMQVFPGKDRAEALKMAEEIREKMIDRANACLFSDRTANGFERVAVTMGVASYPVDGVEALPLSRAAEDDLFRAKYSRGKAYLYKSVLSEISTLKIKDAFPSLQAFVALINIKDRYTFGHSERVEAYSLTLAEKLGLSEEEKGMLRYGAYLHDIGKIEIETSTLNKTGPLTGKEWEIMKSHTVWGGEMVKPLVAFRAIVPIIRSHHENYDGSGYPDGLRKEEITLQARIVRIADSFDAMTTDRPYRKGASFAEACEELARHAGTLYDAELVDSFITAIQETPQIA